MTETTPRRRTSRKQAFTEADAERDRRALAALNAPANRAKILGLIGVGHSVEHVIEVGRHHRSWTAEDVRRTLASAGITPPPPPFGGGARPGPASRPIRLTEVQTDVLREMCTGAGVDVIAARLFLTRPTIYRHVSAICEALQAEDRAHAISLVLTGRVRVLPPS